MSTPKGYPTQEKDDRLKSEFATVEPVRLLQHAMSVLAHQFVREVGTDAVDSATTSVITAASHAAQKGDVIRFTSGALSGAEVKVNETDTNTITLAETLSAAPAAAVTFQILRHKYPTVSSTGAVEISGGSFSTGPVEYVRDTLDTQVEEDTATPGNNRPLPVKLTSTGSTTPLGESGNEIQADIIASALPTGAATEATLATLMLDATGAAIGSDTTSIDGKTPALGAALTAASTPVNIASDQTVPVSAASLPLPSGAATEATLSTVAGDTTSLDGKVTTCDTDDVQQTTHDDLNCNANLQVGDADNSGTNPVFTDRLDVFDAEYIDFSSSNLPGNATNPLEVVASLGSTVKAMQIFDTGGAPIEVMTGAAASEVRKFVAGPGTDQTVEVSIASGTRVSIRRLDDAAALAVGDISINFLS